VVRERCLREQERQTDPDPNQSSQLHNSSLSSPAKGWHFSGQSQITANVDYFEYVRESDAIARSPTDL
jgi:hypothetical protein